MVQLVFVNEQSLSTQHLSDRQAEDTINNLVDVLIEARKKIPRLAAVSKDRLIALQVGATYSIARWLNDAPKDRKRFLLSLAQIAPFRAVSEIADLDMDAFQCEYRGAPFDGVELLGIGLARLYGSFAVSLDADERWALPLIPIRAMQIEDGGSITVSDEEVIHATNTAHITTHEQALARILKNDVSSAADLWARRGEYLPNLRFLEQVEKDLQSLQAHALRQVVTWLFDLNSGLTGWQPAQQPTPNFPSHTTNESQGRKPFFEWYYAGAIRSFAMHGRYTPGAGRIHFATIGEERVCVVGYIGPKINSVMAR